MVSIKMIIESGRPNFYPIGETGASCYGGKLLQSSLNFHPLSEHLQTQIPYVY